MKILLVFLCLFLSFATSSFGQEDLPIVGKVSDLNGKTKVYLSTETTESRQLIQKMIDKNKSLSIVGDVKDADFILEFKQISKQMPPRYGAGKYEDTAEMRAYFYNSEKRKVVAWSQTKDVYKKGWGLPKPNETVLTQEFLKVFKKGSK